MRERLESQKVLNSAEFENITNKQLVTVAAYLELQPLVRSCYTNPEWRNYKRRAYLV